MFEKLIKLFFDRKEGNKITVISVDNREIKSVPTTKRVSESSGVYGSFREREMFYQEIFTQYN